MVPVRRILIPTDFSGPSDRALQVACALARDHGAELVILHAVPAAAVIYGPPPEEYLEHLREELKRLGAADPKTRVVHELVEGDPARAILRAAREAGCDLIVMGTHGRTGLDRLLMGSVAEEVVRNAPCPVLAVKLPTS
jgi:nucleotide-binding universal stress UspA family protein